MGRRTPQPGIRASDNSRFRVFGGAFFMTFCQHMLEELLEDDQQISLMIYAAAADGDCWIN